jgi:hypothetical protein
MDTVLISIISRNIKEENENFKNRESMITMDSRFSADSGEGVYKLDADVRKTVYELDGEILSVVHELPFPDIIGKGRDRFHLEVRKGIHHLYPDVRERIHHPHLTGEADIFKISVSIDGACGKGRNPGEKKEE